MNPVELYKLLPMKNCGKCIQKLCMPFAFAVIKGEADISACTLLTPQDKTDITARLVRTDWRENLITTLRDEISKIKFSDIAKDIGGEVRGQKLILRFLGREFSISTDGEITTTGNITPWVKMLLLYYIKTSGKGELTGKWVSFSELKNGMLKSFAFKRECEMPLNEILNQSLDKSARVLERLGAVKQDGFATPHAWLIFLLPKIPVLILYWQEEEDIPSQTKILFDSTADRFLDVESLVFLTEGFVKNIQYGMM